MIRDKEEICEAIPGATDLGVSAADSTDGEVGEGHGKRVRFRSKFHFHHMVVGTWRKLLNSVELQLPFRHENNNAPLCRLLESL